MNYRGLSLWHDTVDDDWAPRESLSSNIEADVAIVGAGLTGLWTAYYLLDRDPSLRVVLLDSEVAGFGASGRNGGWCSALFPASTTALEKRHGLDAALRMRTAMIDTVDEVGRVALLEKIECDFVKGGTLSIARSPVQLHSARLEVSEAERYGVDQIRFADAVPRATGALGATLDPACARVHPAKLVRGLARAVEKLGGSIFERSTVTHWQAGRVYTERATVAAASIIIATEGYSATFADTHRRLLPLYSLMIATEPLPDAVWHDIGIEHGQTFTDFRHLLIYGQRTADNRFAFGGRGARYHWNSAISPSFDRDARVFDHLRSSLFELFPQARDVAITHSWGGPLGVPRDWHASASFDPETRIGWAGGYVGDGLSTTNLAGRTLADLITERSTDLTALPWVNHRSPRWEIEPFRFVGANLGMTAMAIADAEERSTGRSSIAAKLMGPLVGH